MNVITCSVDDCGHTATTDIWPEDDSRAWLCDHHAYVSLVEPWVVFTVGGRELMRDTAGMWAYIPEADEHLRKLAIKAGLTP